MTWYTTQAHSPEKLKDELDRLDTAGHTIFSVVVHGGSFVIISNTP